MTSPSKRRPDGERPETLADADLEGVQGAGLMDTPIGGWGVTDNPQQVGQTVSHVLKNRTQISSTAVRNSK